jgi:hypothetical protein
MQTGTNLRSPRIQNKAEHLCLWDCMLGSASGETAVRYPSIHNGGRYS